MTFSNMQSQAVQAILGGVEKPSRYLGTEIHRVVKDPAAARLRMVFAFPDLYEIGTSHFGIQILYHLMNRYPEIYAERVFAPAGDMEQALRQNRAALFSLETRTPLGQFDIIGFSLLYELNYTNVLNMLDLAGIPLYAQQRSGRDPLVIAGGPCVANPEPMAPFFDAMVFGDGEGVLPEMAETWLRWKAAGGEDRQALLEQWSHLEGVYIPAFFKAEVSAEGFQILTPLLATHARVTRAVVPDLDRTFFPVAPVIPFGKPVHDRLRLEISRGCGRGCRFCQAGMIYRPVRERSVATLLDLAEKSLATTGYEDLSLLSLSTGDYSGLDSLVAQLMQHCRDRRTAVSLPSMRAGTLSPELMEQIKQVRKTGFTIAPEAGSQRLRDVINKNVSFVDVEETVSDAFALGWKVIKLYFMIGLPTESRADLEAIVGMVERLRTLRGGGKRRAQINVSFSTFIPKAHTPFQWASQISSEESQARIDFLKTRLRVPGIQVKWQNPGMSLLEGVMARGDRRIAAVIEAAWRDGCRFDGWSDRFDWVRWMRAFESSGLPIDFFTSRTRSCEEPLPWQHMASRVESDFLKSEWRAALEGRTQSACRQGSCQQCGVCNFKELKPLHGPQQAAEKTAGRAPDTAAEVDYQAVELIYSKREEARFFGHLELAAIFARALRRAGIDVLYSQGFHPMPRISFSDPLPLGMESCGERMVIRMGAHVGLKELAEGLRAQLPKGLEIVSCRPAVKRSKSEEENADSYQILISVADCSDERLELFRRSAQWLCRRRRKEHIREIDLKTLIATFERIDPDRMELRIHRQEGCGIRPLDVLRSIFELDDPALARVRVVKLAAECRPVR